MASSAAKGARYKARTKAWLEERGYQVAHMERVHRVFGRDFSVKRDQFGADLLAMNAERLIFVQVKGANATTKMLAGARAFAEFKFPPFAERWVVAWKFRARAPVVLDAASGEFLNV